MSISSYSSVSDDATFYRIHRMGLYLSLMEGFILSLRLRILSLQIQFNVAFAKLTFSDRYGKTKERSY